MNFLKTTDLTLYSYPTAEEEQAIDKVIEVMTTIGEEGRAHTFNWNQAMETSLNSLYHSEWPLLLRWITYFQALCQTLLAYQRFTRAEKIDRKAYLEHVSTLAQTLLKAEGIQGTNKEKLARQKLKSFSKRLKGAIWLNQAQVEVELKRILVEIHADFSHQESYSTVQLIFEEARKRAREDIKSWIEQQLESKLPGEESWKELCRTHLTSNPETFDREIETILRLAEPKTRCQIATIDQLFSRSFTQLSPYQPVSKQERERFIQMVRDPILPLLQTKLAKESLNTHLSSLTFTDLSIARSDVEMKLQAITNEIGSQIHHLEGEPAEFFIKVNELKEQVLPEPSREEDLKALLATLPPQDQPWLKECFLKRKETLSREKFLESLPQQFKNQRILLLQDLEYIQLFFKDPILGRKILYFIRARAIPYEEQRGFYINKQQALQRLQQWTPLFDPLIEWINRTENVDRVLYDYWVETLIDKLSIDDFINEVIVPYEKQGLPCIFADLKPYIYQRLREHLKMDKETFGHIFIPTEGNSNFDDFKAELRLFFPREEEIMFFPPSDFEIIETTVREVCEPLAEQDA